MTTGFRIQHAVEIHLSILDWFTGSFDERDIIRTIRYWSPVTLEE